ncbi:transglutaminase-like domain-containing protein [Angustibacter speluncae]
MTATAAPPQVDVPLGGGRAPRPGATPPGAVERLPRLGTALLGVAAAGWGFARVLEPSATVGPLLVGVLVPGVLLVVAALSARAVGRATPTPAITVPLALLLLLGGGPFAAGLLAPTPGPVTGFDALRAFGGTLRTVLTSTLPATADAPTVLALLLVVGVVALLAGEAALRSRFALLPFVPSVLLLGAAVAFGLPAGGTALLLAAALVLLAAVHVALARVLPAPGAETGVQAPAPDLVSSLVRIAAVVVVAALAAGVGTVVGPRLPGADTRPPFDPRQYVQPPEQTSAGQSPLSRVSSWLAGPVRPLFAVDGGLEPTDRLRWVSLDSYDGTSWTTSESYVVAGPRVPDGPEGDDGASERSVSTRVAVGTLPGPWLPAPDRPTAVRGLTVKVAPSSGDLVATTARTEGSVYDVTSTVRTLDDEWVKAAGAGAQPFLDPLRSLPAGVPVGIGAAADEATAGSTSDIQRLLLLERWMRTNLEYDPAALPGHSLKVLGDFVVPGEAGTMEQFAASYALMARHLGYASRVTVAFTPGTAADDPARLAPVEGAVDVDSTPLTDDPDLADPTRLLDGAGVAVTTRDVLVYPEVWLGELGWRPFYPVPVPGAAGDDEIVEGLGAQPGGLSVDDVTPPAGGGAGEQQDEPELVESDPLSVWETIGLTGLVLVAALLLWVLGVLVATALGRRRRRGSGSARDRTLAAWREVQDGLAAGGVRDVRSMTGAQAVAAGGAVLGDDARAPLGTVATAATRALFAPGTVDEQEAVRAWEGADDVARRVRRRRGWKGAVLDLLAPPRRR